jgi:hypothetical protein
MQMFSSSHPVLKHHQSVFFSLTDTESFTPIENETKLYFVYFNLRFQRGQVRQEFWIEIYQWFTELKVITNLFLYAVLIKSCDSSVGIALGYGLDDRGCRVRFPAVAGNFSLHHRVQNGSGSHPASYPMGTSGSFPGGKAARAWSWPLTSI